MVIIPGKQKNLAVRFYANAVDYTIYFLLFFVYTYALGTQDENGTYRVTGIESLGVVLLWILYFPVCEAVGGQTLGKKAFDLYIVDLSGRTPSFIQAFIRRLLDFFEMSTLGIMAVLAINYSARNQRIGDMIAGTTVVKTLTTCRFCNASLELSLQEAARATFACPTCGKLN